MFSLPNIWSLSISLSSKEIRDDYQRNGDKKRREKHHVSSTDLNEPYHKRRHKKNDFNSKYSFYSTSIGSIVGHDEIWLVDNGASRNMIGGCVILIELVEKKICQRV